MKILFGTRSITNGNETYMYAVECPNSNVITEIFGEVGNEGEIGLDRLHTIKSQLTDFLSSNKEPTEEHNALSDILDLFYVFEEIDFSNNIVIFQCICSYEEEKIKKLFEDDNVLRECVRQKGNLKKLAKQRGIKLVTPV